MILVLKNKMQSLISTIQKVYIPVIEEFNNVRLPSLEHGLGCSINEAFTDPKTKTAETTKILSKIIDNTFYRHVHELEPTFVVDEGVGRDNLYGDIPIEQKTTFTKNNCSWTGNGYEKTSCHLLKKFSKNESGRINGCFIAIVNLNECVSKWTPPKIKSNYSSLHLEIEDIDKIHVIVGSLKPKKKYLEPVLVEV
jgi:hypothetical protein